MIKRRLLFESENKRPIFDRPSRHPRLCPPALKLANLRKFCAVCSNNVKEHTENHFTLHNLSCEICEHIDFVSHNSYALICYVCLKKFDRKDKLDDHAKKHSSNNPYSCDICNLGFSSGYNLKRHSSDDEKRGPNRTPIRAHLLNSLGTPNRVKLSIIANSKHQYYSCCVIS